MTAVLETLVSRHDLRLVSLALGICIFGSVAALRLFLRATQDRGQMRAAWIFVASVVAGSAVWCTHFIAMLAYMPGMRVHYEPVLTIVSLLVAVAGMNAGLFVAALDRRGVFPALGGAIVGLAIAAMHYTGMAACELGGAEQWHPGLVAASTALGLVCSALAMTATLGQMRRPMARFGAHFLVLGILSVHFIGMAALRMGPAMGPPRLDQGSAPLGLATGAVGLMVVAAGMVAWLVDRNLQREAGDRIARLSTIDPHTGLPNLAAFEAEIADRLNTIKQTEGLQILTLKLFNLSEIVGLHGRRVGDLAIQTAVQRYEQVRRPDIFVARTGKAEFASVGRLLGPAEIHQRLESIAAVLAAPMVIDMVDVVLDVRVGVSRYPADGRSAADLVRCSHLALDRAKADPLRSICIYDELPDLALLRRQILSEDLRSALELGQLELYYQPQVMIRDRRVLGYEALLRWHHPRFGMVPPSDFIPLAEANGTIVAIGAWALRTACQTAASWPNKCTVAVNVSPLQLRDPILPQRILEALVESGLNSRRLEIELTESLLLDDRNRALYVLRRIRALGVRLALDDFGTGYSSMDILRHFAFDKIKLDRSFVGDVETNPQSLAILHAMLAMGRSLDIPVLVEGVESERQLAILESQGCRKVQGYLTGRPVPAEAIAGGNAEQAPPLLQAG